MKRSDFIKKSITEGTCVRSEVHEDSATMQYFNTIGESMDISSFPMVPINTIEKRIFMLQGADGQCFLVFDAYLLENIYTLSHILYINDDQKLLQSFMWKALSEECYTYHKMNSALKFATKYMNCLENVINEIKGGAFPERESDILFIQQAFLIAHEIYHYSIHRDLNTQSRELDSKKSYLKFLYDYMSFHFPGISDGREALINNQLLAEECYCDSAGIIHAIDIGVKVKRLDAAEAGVAATLALMNQYIISIIQEWVKTSGNVSIEKLHNLFLLRLVNLKAFTRDYLKECYETSDEREYRKLIKEVNDKWEMNIFDPVLNVLKECYLDVQEADTLQVLTKEEKKRIKAVLWGVFCL